MSIEFDVCYRPVSDIQLPRLASLKLLLVVGGCADIADIAFAVSIQVRYKTT